MAPAKSTAGASTTGEGRVQAQAVRESGESHARASAQARAAMREQRLKAHPHAEVLGPELVVCRLCGQHIKLSTKSAYDAFHWNKHIERCARRAPAAREQRVVRAAERKRSKMSKDAAHQAEKRTALTIRLRAKGATEPSSTSEAVSAPVHVKEETPERPIDMTSPSSPLSHSSPLLETPSPPPAAPLQPEPDFLMEDYYRRSRRRGTRELSPFTLEAAASWTWSQVKEPVWVVRSYSSSESQASENSSTSVKNPERTTSGMRMSDVNDGWSNGSLAFGSNENEVRPIARK